LKSFLELEHAHYNNQERSMNLLPPIIVTAILCVFSYFWGQHEEAKKLDRINTAIHQETKHALDDVRGEVTRIESEYNAKTTKMQEQWDMEIVPLLVIARKKCKEGNPTSACNAANNAVLESVFNLKQKINHPK
jgi:hypothetical protein